MEKDLGKHPEGQAPEKMLSQAWSTATLEAGIAVVQGQQVKAEDDEEVLSLQAQLQDCCGCGPCSTRFCVNMSANITCSKTLCCPGGDEKAPCGVCRPGCHLAGCTDSRCTCFRDYASATFEEGCLDYACSGDSKEVTFPGWGICVRTLCKKCMLLS